MTDAIIYDFQHAHEALKKLEAERAKEPKPELPEMDLSAMYGTITMEEYLG